MMFYSGGLLVLFIMGRSFTLSMFYGLLSFALLAWLIRYFNWQPDGHPLAIHTDPNCIRAKLGS
jgi:hypothetical protein